MQTIFGKISKFLFGFVNEMHKIKIYQHTFLNLLICTEFPPFNLESHKTNVHHTNAL